MIRGQRFKDSRDTRGRLRLMAGPEVDGTPAAARILQDARMYATVLAPGESVTSALAPDRHAWVQCVTGDAEVNGLSIKAGDGVAVSEEPAVVLRGAGAAGAELLLFDLA